jgi:hypothetical protein
MGAMQKPPEILDLVKFYLPTQDRLMELREYEARRNNAKVPDPSSVKT